jgi:hypothetical protein
MMDDGYGQQSNQYNTGSILAGAGTQAAAGAAAGSVVGPIGTLAGGILGAGWGLYSGLHEKSQANKLLKSNLYPTQPIPQGIQQDATRANRLALQGLPSAQYQQAMNNIQRQQENAIVASQGQRAGMGTIGNIQQGTQDALLGLSAQDQAERIKNIQNAQQQNQVLGQYQNQAFDWNQKNRYLQNYQYGMSLLGAGNQNIARGVDTGLSGLVRSSNSPYLSGLFGNGGGNTGTNGLSSGSSLLSSQANQSIPMLQNPGI